MAKTNGRSTNGNGKHSRSTTLVAPPGGIRLRGKTIRTGQRIPAKYGRLLEKGVISQDPAKDVPGAPPNFARDLIPQIITFSGRVAAVSQVYRNPDQAVLDSLENARFMRNDCSIMECLEARQRSVALLNWHLEPENKDDPKQNQLVEDLTDILKAIPQFTEYRRNLLEALWYGRYAIQHAYDFKRIKGKRRTIVKRWKPINGDKLAFRYDDGSGKYEDGQVGIRVGAMYRSGDVIGGNRVVEYTDYGMAYFLDPWERSRLAVHKHIIEDGVYEDPISAGRIHGVGIRDRIYWCWFQKQETMANLMEVIERTGTGFTIYRYPAHNAQAKAEMEELAEKQTRSNVILLPSNPGDPTMDAYAIERIEPSTAGIMAMKEIIHEFFGWQIKRYILGQILSSESAATGLGSGVADLHEGTFLQICQYDSTKLEETITTDLVEPLKSFNMPWARDISVLFKIDTKSNESEKKLSAFKQAWDMGTELKAQDVYDVIGASMPGDNDKKLLNPTILQQMRLWEQSQVGGMAGVSSGQPDLAGMFGPLMGLLDSGGGGEVGQQDGIQSGGDIDQSADNGISPNGKPSRPQRFMKDASGHEHNGKDKDDVAWYETNGFSKYAKRALKSSPGQLDLFGGVKSEATGSATTWKEEQHPRDDSGQFTNKATGQKSEAVHGMLDTPEHIDHPSMADMFAITPKEEHGKLAEIISQKRPELAEPAKQWQEHHGDGDKSQTDLFGEPVKSETPKQKPPEFGSTGGKQSALFSTSGLPNQMNLFDDVGIPDELVQKSQRRDNQKVSQDEHPGNGSIVTDKNENSTMASETATRKRETPVTEGNTKPNLRSRKENQTVTKNQIFSRLARRLKAAGLKVTRSDRSETIYVGLGPVDLRISGHELGVADYGTRPQRHHGPEAVVSSMDMATIVAEALYEARQWVRDSAWDWSAGNRQRAAATLRGLRRVWEDL